MSDTCCKKVYSGYHSYVCGKTAKFEFNGKHYCGIHNPNKAPTKGQIEAEKRREEERARWKLQRAAPELLDSLIYLRNCAVDGIKPALKEVNELIAKVEGGQS